MTRKKNPDKRRGSIMQVRQELHPLGGFWLALSYLTKEQTGFFKINVFPGVVCSPAYQLSRLFSRFRYFNVQKPG